MTQEEILDYNKKCAEFLGYELITPEMRKTPEQWGDNSYWEHKDRDNVHTSKKVLGREGYLSLHSDWNWIMEVVEAIEKLPGGKWFVHISAGEAYPVVRIEDGNEEPQFDVMVNVNNCVGYGEDLHLTKKQALVKAINQFFRLYDNKRSK